MKLHKVETKQIRSKQVAANINYKPNQNRSKTNARFCQNGKYVLQRCCLIFFLDVDDFLRNFASHAAALFGRRTVLYTELSMSNLGSTLCPLAGIGSWLSACRRPCPSRPPYDFAQVISQQIGLSRSSTLLKHVQNQRLHGIVFNFATSLVYRRGSAGLT